MFIELSQLPFEVQQHIMATTTPVEIVNHGRLVAIIQPQSSKVQQNAYDFFANLDYPEHIADIELELPKRMHNQRPIPFEDDDKSLFDVFAQADPAVADIELELPKRTMNNNSIY